MAAVCCLGGLLPANALVYGQLYFITRFEIEYALDHEDHIPIEELLELEVGLRATPDGFVAPRPVDRTVRMRLSSLPRGARFSVTAIQHITQHVVSTFNRRGFNGVIVMVPEIEQGTGRDLRTADDTTLTLRIWTGRVSELTTVADGARFRGLSIDERTDNAAHDWIRERAPVQPGGRRGLLDVQALEDYAALVSRHPGRHVEVELEPGIRPGTTAVNLRVAENKPWYAYFQYSNTGTESTTDHRQRFGVAHNQLTGRDDSLRLDYITGDFDSTHAVLGTYESPFSLALPQLRFRIGGWWSRFDPSELGDFDGNFTGRQASGDGALLLNVLQVRDYFLDLSLGGRAQHIEIENALGNSTQNSDVTYVLPYMGVSLERETPTSRLRVGAIFDAGLTSSSQEALDLLGTANATQNFTRLQVEAWWSSFLEPLINRQAWEDPSTPESSTLAHEIAVRFRGQFAFDNRLAPNYRDVAGGFYTVRGYPQALVARDNLLLGSLEYRFHLARFLAPGSDAPEIWGIGNFRTRAPHVWGRPDWDLIFRLFTDTAYVTANDRIGGEATETLWSLGFGIELQFLRNLIVRFDMAQALEGVNRTESGSTEVHVEATLLY